MDPIFATSFSPGTQGIRIGDVEIEKLAEVDGVVFVTCPREHASPEWTRRWDLEEMRRKHYEALGAELRAEMEAADVEARAAIERAEAEAAERAAADAAAREQLARQEAEAAAARAEEERRQADEAARAAAATHEPAPGDKKRGRR